MEYEEALAYLHTRPRRPGRQASLERMRRLMERLGNPQRGLKTVHIAGTNGKGSTLKMLEGMLLPGGSGAGRCGGKDRCGRRRHGGVPRRV